MTNGGPQPDGLLDTSVFVALETGRPVSALPENGAVSVVTLAELELGILMAENRAIVVRRLNTLSQAQTLFSPLPIDIHTAHIFAEITAESRKAGWRANAMDGWIAATAVAHNLILYTQDRDFANFPRLSVVFV